VDEPPVGMSWTWVRVPPPPPKRGPIGAPFFVYREAKDGRLVTLCFLPGADNQRYSTWLVRSSLMGTTAQDFMPRFMGRSPGRGMGSAGTAPRLPSDLSHPCDHRHAHGLFPGTHAHGTYDHGPGASGCSRPPQPSAHGTSVRVRSDRRRLRAGSAPRSSSNRVGRVVPNAPEPRPSDHPGDPSTRRSTDGFGWDAPSGLPPGAVGGPPARCGCGSREGPRRGESGRRQARHSAPRARQVEAIWPLSFAYRSP